MQREQSSRLRLLNTLNYEPETYYYIHMVKWKIGG